MVLEVLGCSGSELVKAHPCAFLLGDAVLLDVGSGAGQLNLNQQLKIQDIVLSHAHLDHVRDLAFIAENIYSRGGTLTVWSRATTLKKIKTHLLNGKIWADFTELPSLEEPTIKLHVWPEQGLLTLVGVTFEAIPVNHPGGCDAFFVDSGQGILVYSGDTGPTDTLWHEVNRRGADVRAILIECSFPNRMKQIAHDSGHLTPDLLASELSKLQNNAIPIYVYHLKAPYELEIQAELRDVLPRPFHMLQAGDKITF